VRVVLQRVRWATVHVEGEQIAAIGPGLLALVGVAAGDGPDDARRLGEKTARLRILAGPERPFDLSLRDVPGAELLCVSQFTLLADLRRGNRPSWAGAAAPELAAPLVEAFADAVHAEGVPVARGRVGAAMAGGRETDGPVTVVLDSADLAGPRRRGGE
jgi:D-tyrosyl-tRNA(Tyr) deacylase